MHPSHKTNPTIRGTRLEIEAAAKELRRRSTPAEQKLWMAVRNRRFKGLKFRRQHPVGPFILDLCCPERRLAVELDGPIHTAQQEYDEARTLHLMSYAWRVIRFRNEDVLENLDRVLAAMEAALAGTPSPPNPLSQQLGERGSRNPNSDDELLRL